MREKLEFLDHLKTEPSNTFSNAIRELRTSLMLAPDTGLPRVIAITSSVSDEGSAPTALALARDLAHLNKGVLLIDTDLNGEGFQPYFGDEPTRGIASVLRGEHQVDQCIHRPEFLQADVLFANESSTEVADLFLSGVFRDFISEMKDWYDVIIIHAPAVNTSPSTRIVLNSAEALLFSVKWDSTEKSQLDGALRLLSHANLNVLGMILNNSQKIAKPFGQSLTQRMDRPKTATEKKTVKDVSFPIFSSTRRSAA